MVDLVGIEPTTSSMPWKYQGRPLLTAKDLQAGRVGKTGKIGAICYQNATKIESGSNGADLWGISSIFAICKRFDFTRNGQSRDVRLLLSQDESWGHMSSSTEQLGLE
jgi:hypothetical protein